MCLEVKAQVKKVPGLCDSSHPLVTVFGVFRAQLQSLLVVVIERDGEVILENKITGKEKYLLKRQRRDVTRVAGIPTEGKQQDSASRVRVEHKWVSKRASDSESHYKASVR